jgi:hypothetical protein
MAKEISSKSVTFAKGGTNKMAPQMKTGTQVPGQSASMGRNGQIAKGGGSKMAGKGMARAAKAGATVSN